MGNSPHPTPILPVPSSSSTTGEDAIMDDDNDDNDDIGRPQLPRAEHQTEILKAAWTEEMI